MYGFHKNTLICDNFFVKLPTLQCEIEKLYILNAEFLSIVSARDILHDIPQFERSWWSFDDIKLCQANQGRSKNLVLLGSRK